MREIKFRFWDGSRIWTLQPIDENVITLQTKVPVMQFTGLKDKNGTEIYEGDILYRKRSGTFKGDPEREEHAVVEFTDAEFVARYIQNVQGSTNVRYFLSVPTPFAVIGNIYEKPDLLSDNK